MTSGLGPMNVMPRGLAYFGEIGVFAEEAVSRMNRVDVGDFRGADDRGDIEIAARALGRADADCLVGEADMELLRSASEYTATVRMPRSRQAQMTRSGDLAAVGNQNLSETCLGGPNREQRFAVLDGPAVLHQLAATIPGHFGLDLVHQLHRLDDAEHLTGGHAVADLHEWRRARRGGFVVRARL